MLCCLGGWNSGTLAMPVRVMFNLIAIHFQISAALCIADWRLLSPKILLGLSSELLAWGLYLGARTPINGVLMVQSWRQRWWMPCSRERCMELR
jgi:hypothetical protein